MSSLNWYLVSTRPYKRDLFLKQLDFAIGQHQLNEIFLDQFTPTDEIYKDMVLIQVSDLQLARTYLSQIDHFQKIEPRALSEKQVQQFLKSCS
ncbi:MAG: hypothetical protein AB4041_00895 [Microcystaceae cyanobacterium]